MDKLLASRFARLQTSLERRSIHPSLHYETAEQTRKWLVIHQKYSPAFTSSNTANLYKKAFTHFTRSWKKRSIQVISLGCGSGHKDVVLLQILQKQGHSVEYIPCDISTELVLESAMQAQYLIPGITCNPIVCDLEQASDLKKILNTNKSPKSSSFQRVFLFFGILPSLEGDQAYKCLRQLLRVNDLLLVSVNLLSEKNNKKSIHKIMSQYDNFETRDWLGTLLLELGVPQEAGRMHFELESPSKEEKCYRIVATYRFKKNVQMIVQNRKYHFHPGETLTLFFSNRHTPSLASKFLKQLHISNPSIWIDSINREAVLGGYPYGEIFSRKTRVFTIES